MVRRYAGVTDCVRASLRNAVAEACGAAPDESWIDGIERAVLEALCNGKAAA
jgi:hypothetical protein